MNLVGEIPLGLERKKWVGGRYRLEIRMTGTRGRVSSQYLQSSTIKSRRCRGCDNQKLTIRGLSWSSAWIASLFPWARTDKCESRSDSNNWNATANQCRSRTTGSIRALSNVGQVNFIVDRIFTEFPEDCYETRKSPHHSLFDPAYCPSSWSTTVPRQLRGSLPRRALDRGFC